MIPAVPAAPAFAVSAKLADSEYDPNPQYTFAYDVQDALTGDSKNQIESRNGDFVQGQYSLNDPDGTRRTVNYIADPINGFNAIVSKAPLIQAVAKVAAAPVVAASRVAVPAKVVAAAPVAAPLVAQSAPVYTSPVAKIAAAPAAYTAPFAPASFAYTTGALSYPVVPKVTAPITYAAYTF